MRQLSDAPSAHDAKRMAEQLTAATLARQAWLASRPVLQQSMRAA